MTTPIATEESTPLSRELSNLHNINESLKHTISGLETISENLNVLTTNTKNATTLAKIYTDIHEKNRRLHGVLENDRDMPEDVDGHIDVLQRRVDELKKQLGEFN